MCDLKVMQINVQCSLIWEFMLYEFKLSHNTMEASNQKYFLYESWKYSWLQYNNLKVEEISHGLQELWQVRPKNDSKTGFQTIETNLSSSTWVQHLTVQYGTHCHDLGKKHQLLLNCVSHYQNIAKLLTHPSNINKEHKKRFYYYFWLWIFSK